MKFYTEFVGKSPSELIKEADDEEETGILLKRRKIKRYLFDYIDYLNGLDVSPNTARIHLEAVKSFYKHLDVQLPNLPKNERDVAPLEKNLKIPTKDDLIETLRVCDPLEKATLLVGISSGLSSNEIKNLKIGEFKEGYDSHTEITTLKLRRGKTGVDFITFLSPEASRAVWDYLKYRGRTIKFHEVKRERQLEKQRVTSDDGYLFILQSVPEAYLATKDEEMRKFKRDTFMCIYRTISLKAKKNALKGDWNLIRSHNMRKFFNSALLNAGADSFFVEYCMGHKLDKTKAAYFRGDPVKLRDIYARYIPYLTIQRDLDISETPDYKRMTKEIEGLKAKLETETTRSAEMRIIKDNLDFIDFVKESDTTESLKQIMIDSSIKVRDEKLEELKKRKKPENIPSVLETEDNFDDTKPIDEDKLAYRHELEDEYESIRDRL